jgi:hypothetical protein
MFLMQTSQAKRMRKYQILMLVLFVLTGSVGLILTMRWYSLPKKRN